MKNYDETVIRLNAVDNLNADLLPDRYFLPAVVICRPWKNKAERIAAYRGNRYRSIPRIIFLFGRVRRLGDLMLTITTVAPFVEY